ncbi:pyridoxal phosphate-dependent aminotransferase [Geomicrobium halophilum]
MEDGFTLYTENAGMASVREAISRRMKRDYNVNVPINRILVSAGAVSALNLALLSIVEIGEGVLLPDPAYPNYESLIRMQGAIPVFYRTKAENDFLPDVSDIEKRITPFTKEIIINSPSNPTGAVFTEEKSQQILQLAKEHELYIISDELYDELIYEGKHISPLSADPSMKDHIISIFGFSKVYAMTGWRLAYAIVPERLWGVMCKLQEPVTTCAPSISQKAGEAALDGSKDFVKEMLDIYKQHRDIACDLLKQYHMDFITPKGSFYIPIDIACTGMSAKEFAMGLLMKQKIVAAPCDTFGPSGKSLIRICFAGDIEQ